MILSTDGAEHHPGAALPFLPALETALTQLPTDRPGIRLNPGGPLAGLLGPEALGQETIARLGPATRPVRATLFDKSATTNWALGWHQDRTIAVAARAEVPGFGPWSVKAGVAHVEPPFALIERMRTIRVHLDAVDADNAPLLIAPGSHRLGRIAAVEAEAVAARCGTAACLAERGDIWLYATAILHASTAATRPRHRRVLQVDYSADVLPSPLVWYGG